VESRLLGRTGAVVSVLGFGGMELRGPPRVRALAYDEAAALLHAVLDAGVTVIDTSVDYGTSEEVIGRTLAARRDEYFLCSKCGCSLDEAAGATGPYPHDWRPENIRAGVEQSLRRLGTDRLDLLQVHMSPSRSQMEADGTVGAMRQLQAEGSVRFLGMSGILPNLPDHIAMDVFDVFQIPYSAVQREHEDLITAAAAAGAGTLIRGGSARGGASEDNAWQADPLGLPPGEGRRRWDESGVEALLEGMSRFELVLRFTISHPGLSSTIVGTSNVEHLRSNVAIVEKGPLPSDLYEEAKRRLLPGPVAPHAPPPPRAS
jgi:aryl-alcohol dehydrogenase-like predicted oxidoreductase